MFLQESHLNDTQRYESEREAMGRQFSNQSFPWGTRTPTGRKISRVSVASADSSFADEFVVSYSNDRDENFSSDGMMDECPNTPGSNRSTGTWTRVKSSFRSPRRSKSTLSDDQLSNLGDNDDTLYEEALHDEEDSSHARPMLPDPNDPGLLESALQQHDDDNSSWIHNSSWIRRKPRSDRSLKEWVAKVLAADGSTIDDIRGFDEKDSSRIPECCRIRKMSRLFVIALVVILVAITCVAVGVVVASSAGGEPNNSKSGAEPVTPEANLTEETVKDTPSGAPTIYNQEDDGSGVHATWSSSSADWIDGISSRPYHGRGHHFQQSVSVSSDGSMVASVVNSKLTFFVYTDSWKRVDGPQVDENVVSVSFDEKGTRLAMATMGHNKSGHVRILDFDGARWRWIGQEVPFLFAPRVSIALSSDGSTVVVGQAGDSTSRGSVVVLRFNKHSGWWLPAGETLTGDTEWDLFGMSVSVNYDGNVIAIGIPGKYANGNNGAGAVRIYRYQSEEWKQLGKDINGRHSDEQFGYSVSMSLDGTRLAVGVSYIVETCYIFEVSNDSWSQLGPSIEHEQVQGTRIAVALSGNGNTLAIGGTNRCRVYQFASATWTMVGEFSGNTEGFGESVSLSSNGHKVAIAGGQIDQDMYVRIVQR